MKSNRLRKEYAKGTLRRNDLAINPIDQLSRWMEEVSDLVIEPHAMALCTVNPSGRPSCRMVLLREWDEAGLVFFTHYASQKGRDLETHPYAAATIFWAEMERQICFTGSVTKTTPAESDAYFAARPRGSQLSAWASKQGKEIENRDELTSSYEHYQKKYEGQAVPRPSTWGGYRLAIETIEFWQGRENRLHDRFLYTRNKTDWTLRRLSP